MYSLHYKKIFELYIYIYIEAEPDLWRTGVLASIVLVRGAPNY